MRVYLCYAGDFPAPLLEKMREKLPPVRKKTVERCKNQAVRDCRTVAYHLLYYALKKECPDLPYTDFEIAANGKPSLQSCPLHFGISYSADVVAVALASHPVGLDIELLRPMRDGFAARWFSACELAEIDASPNPDAATLQCWVRREAAVKRSGEGLHYRREIDTANTRAMTWETKKGTLALAVCPDEEIVLLPVCTEDVLRNAF